MPTKVMACDIETDCATVDDGRCVRQARTVLDDGTPGHARYYRKVWATRGSISATPCAISHNANSIILVAESIHLLAPFFLDAKFFAASNALNAVPVLPT